MDVLFRGWFIWLVASASSLPVATDSGATRIAFGSCNHQRLEQPLWPHVLARKPSLWIWGGDAIYADQLESFTLTPSPRPVFKAGTEASLREDYAAQLQVPGYAKLRESGVPIVGTYDDHDYGLNDGDRYFMSKAAGQAAFLDFIGEPPASPRRRQQGVYGAHRFIFQGYTVQVILLDMRFNRDPYGTPNGDFLGEEQWRWLEQTMAGSDARVHVIVSPLQMLEPRYGTSESWGKFPAAKERLLQLMLSNNLSAPIVLSGDVHLAEINGARCAGNRGRLIEVTSSGMTHSWGTRPPNTDSWLVSTAMAFGMWLSQRVFTLRYQLVDEATGAPQHYLGLNFGELEFDWAAGQVAIRIFGEGGHARLEQTFALTGLDLSGGASEVRCFPERGEPAPGQATAALCLFVTLVLGSLLSPFVCCCVLARRLLPGGQGTSSQKAHKD